MTTFKRHTATSPRTEPLVGRERELAVAHDLERLANDGHGGALLVYGESGIGRTRLLHDVAARFGGTVLTAEAGPSDRWRRLGVIREALAPQVPLTGRPREDVLLAALERLCAAAPTLLAIDDLHHADDASLGFLHRLSRRLDSLGLVVLAAARADPPRVGRLRSALADRGLLTEMVLGPLDPAAVAEMAAARLGTEAGPRVLVELAAAGGNPRYVVDILDALAEHSTGPTGVTAVVVPRPREVDQLTPGTRDVLTLAALLGQSFGARELCVVTRRSMTDLLPHLREALDAAILTDAGENLEFRHAVVRTSLYAVLPPGVRAELHRDAARALDDAGLSAEMVASHLLLATLLASDREWVATVAEQLLSEAPRSAAELWERLRTVVDDEARAGAEAGLATAYLAGGRLRDAEEVARVALASDPPSGPSGALHLSLTLSLLRQGRWDEARRAAERAVSAPALLPDERVAQQVMVAAGALLAGEGDRAREVVGQAEAAANGLGTARAMSSALAARGWILQLDGDLERAEVLLGESTRLASAERGFRTARSYASVLHAQTLADLDRVAEATTALDRAGASAVETGPLHADGYAHLIRVGILMSTGPLPEVTEALDACDAAGKGGDPDVAAPVLLAWRALVALEEAGPGAAGRWLEQIPDQAGPGDALPQFAWVARARAAMALDRGELDGWLRELATAWSLQRTLRRASGLVLLGPLLAEAAAEQGDTALAKAAAGLMEEVAGRAPGVTSRRAAALTARGFAESDGDTLVAAARQWADSPQTLEAARASSRIAKALHRLGLSTEAETVAGDAVRALLASGATYAAQRTRALLPTPPERPSRGASGRARTGWESLTRTERVVASFVEQGESNAEIATRLVLSRRTVESHVSHILAKLQLRSRADLILAAARRGRIPEQADGAMPTDESADA